ncbi:MAG: hypothetical protein AAGC76_18100 [Luteibacter sp.]|jgi:hypothetical protein|uniref:hypothetical protein n=1 Tax=Luteibacter TaxID=242605 RepID=UPI00055C8738|nr:MULTISPECIES: hypothetical protein [unclassified Luteibacter]MDQ7997758.1 hypothetical protein [Luteibacter sp.]MDQ8050948.1 hypothetical protein [Luteibacter sp.]MDR6643103.1 hypothetical protein [Luteibacter sp. 1214]
MSVRLLSDTARVLAEARHVEPDRARRRAWFVEDPIAELGYRTAEDVVEAGETSRLIAMIRAIRAHERGF